MSFLSKITILHIVYRFEYHTTKKKFVTRDVTNFSPIFIMRFQIFSLVILDKYFSPSDNLMPVIFHIKWQLLITITEHDIHLQSWNNNDFVDSKK